jgi:hypothetical protein
MTKKVKPVKAWCIKSPKGEVLADWVNATRRWCISLFLHEHWEWGSWETPHEQGYRCVKVTVTEGWDNA